MNVLTKESAEAMLTMQHTLNSQINPEWMQAGYAWHRAAWLEAAELMDHIGWKWWKAQKPNLVQAQIEVIDIWHFILSAYMVQYEVPVSALLLANDQEPKVTIYQGAMKRLDELNLQQTVDVFASQAAQGTLSVYVFDALRRAVELTWDDVYRMYTAKNALNIFRQDNGYKEGVYVKDWMGEEDNAYLEKVLNANPGINYHDLRAALQLRYSEVMNQGASA